MSDDDVTFLARMSDAGQLTDPSLSGTDYLRLMRLAGLEVTRAYRLTREHVHPVELGRVDQVYILDLIDEARTCAMDMSAA